MNERAKYGAAVVGGYILGRTKKGMAAARFAMWLSSSPQVMDAARTALSAPEVRQVTDQVSGPLADAARKAALAAVLGRIGSLSDNLAKRTEALTTTIEGTASTVTDTASTATDRVTGLLGNDSEGADDEQGEEQQSVDDGERDPDGDGEQSEHGRQRTSDGDDGE